MSGLNYEVAPRSWVEIEDLANDFRKLLGFEDSPLFPVMDVLEKMYQLEIVDLEVREKKEMSGAEGMTDPKGEFIWLREDVYEGALKGEARPRFTVAHELGHWILHRNTDLKPVLTRTECTIPKYRLSEPQANQFAGALLMPSKFFEFNDCNQKIMERHGVSYTAAQTRMGYLMKRGIIK